ncbi:MAG: hypothetical protein AAF411_09665 [Myxococcota bacterium]
MRSYVASLMPGYSLRLLVALSLGACGGSSLRTGERVPSHAPIVVPFELGSCDGPSDAITLRGVELQGRRLRIAFEHGGGCEEHAYRICGSDVVLESYPGQWVVRVLHDGAGDHCRALQTGVLETVLPEAAPSRILGLQPARANEFTLEVD